MNPISIVEREMTEAEYAWLTSSYAQYTLEHGNPVQTSEKVSFVALAGDRFIGCAAGTVERNGLTYNAWFYLSDLFVEKTYRKQGLGALLLRLLEERIAAPGVQHIWTWTAGYEAPGFYRKQGYHVFWEQEQFYATGHSQVGLRKALPQFTREARPRDPAGSDPNPIRLVERAMTEAEFARMNAGFDEHTREQGNPVETSERHGFVALDGERFLGGVSGLASRNWFSITDLFVDRSYRGQGVGSALLRNMEVRATALGIQNMAVCCGSYEAPEFYRKQGYEVCYELENWYASGQHRIGLRKSLHAITGTCG